MKRWVMFVTVLTLMACLAGLGCARAARDTSGFALREETAVNAPFEETWHAVKQVLREQGYDLYTRDKRGAFVAYTPMQRILWMQPRRTKFTIELARVASEETAISIESVRQIYGVTLLTHPDWHDRAQRDPKASQAILDAIQAAVAGGIDVESFVDEMEAPDDAPAAGDAPLIEDAEAVH